MVSFKHEKIYLVSNIKRMQFNTKFYFYLIAVPHIFAALNI